MTSLAPQFHAGKEAAQRALRALGKSVRETGRGSECLLRPRRIVVERVVVTAAPDRPDPEAGPTVIYRLKPAAAPGGHRKGRAAGVPNRGSLGPSYPFWVGDGRDYCA